MIAMTSLLAALACRRDQHHVQRNRPQERRVPHLKQRDAILCSRFAGRRLGSSPGSAIAAMQQNAMHCPFEAT